jgi:hypothetical protein
VLAAFCPDDAWRLMRFHLEGSRDRLFAGGTPDISLKTSLSPAIARQALAASRDH